MRAQPGSSFTIARVVGARPQFMQVPAVMEALKARGIRQVLVHTGQHYDAALSGQFFADLALPSPDVDLAVGSHTQGAATGRMMEKLEAWFLANRPDAILLDGDTNSTLAAALAGAKIHVPVFHIEAGLRDWDRRRPEEINRIVTDHVASLNFAPIPRALENLQNEGLGETAHLVGDVLLDCFELYRGRATATTREGLGLEPGRYHVLTLHRPENTNLEALSRFHEIMTALSTIDMPIVFPIHPRTRPIWDIWIKANPAPPNLRLVDPIGYLEMLDLIMHCECVFTDSGGLSREGMWAGRKCVMLFLVDTWHDCLERNWATIGKTDAASVLSAYDAARPAAPEVIEFFGGGKAAARIAGHVLDYLEAHDRKDAP